MADVEGVALPDAADVDRAAELLGSVIPPTPLQRADRLSALTGLDVWLKREDLTPVRSYKARGAYTVLAGLTDWIGPNGEGIYGTRPWAVYGEGPSVTTTAPANRFGGAVDVRAYTHQDVRFTKKGDIVYAFVMSWPEDGKASIKSLATGSANYPGEVAKVELLGSGEVKFTRDASALVIQTSQRTGRGLFDRFVGTLDEQVPLAAQRFAGGGAGVRFAVAVVVVGIGDAGVADPLGGGELAGQSAERARRVGAWGRRVAVQQDRMGAGRCDAEGEEAFGQGLGDDPETRVRPVAPDEQAGHRGTSRPTLAK